METFFNFWDSLSSPIKWTIVGGAVVLFLTGLFLLFCLIRKKRAAARKVQEKIPLGWYLFDKSRCIIHIFFSYIKTSSVMLVYI